MERSYKVGFQVTSESEAQSEPLRPIRLCLTNKYRSKNPFKTKRSLSSTKRVCNLAGKNQNHIKTSAIDKSLKTFSGIYNICCLFNGKRKTPKLVLGLRSLIAIAEGLMGSISLFYPNQTQMMFKLFEAFISLAIVDLFLVRLSPVFNSLPEC